MGLNKDVEPAVAVVIEKDRHAAGVLDVEPVSMGHLLEGAIALVDIKQIGRVEPADVDIQQPVVVHVDKRRALLPDQGRRALVADPGPVGYILEFPVPELSLIHISEPTRPY